MKISNIQPNFSHSINKVLKTNIPTINKLNTQGFTISISDEARYQYNQLLKFRELSQDEELGRQLRNIHETLGKRQLEIDNANPNNQLEGDIIKNEFRENTLEYTIYNVLEGKIENASHYV